MAKSTHFLFMLVGFATRYNLVVIHEKFSAIYHARFELHITVFQLAIDFWLGSLQAVTVCFLNTTLFFSIIPLVVSNTLDQLSHFLFQREYCLGA